MTTSSVRERFDPRAAAPRIPALLIGLILFGAGIAMMVEANLGLGPWEALNQGIARQLGLQIARHFLETGAEGYPSAAMIKPHRLSGPPLTAPLSPRGCPGTDGSRRRTPGPAAAAAWMLRAGARLTVR